MPSPALAVVPAGTLVLVGGAEDKLGRRSVLTRFVALAGGSKARIVVVPAASAMSRDVLALYDALFGSLGAAEVAGVNPSSRNEADDPALAAAVDRASGVFVTGGNQLRLSALVAGTQLGEAIRRAHGRGAVVGGTSAGASIMSEHMVAFGAGGATPKQRMSQLAAGLGLLPTAIVDQHFDARNRYGRLLSMVAQSPHLLGIGIDEDTAAVVSGARMLEVAGRGAVFVVDASSARSNAHEAKRTAPLLVSGAVLHVLPAGSRFDLEERRLVSFAELRPAPEVARLTRATAAVRHLGRRVIAEHDIDEER